MSYQENTQWLWNDKIFHAAQLLEKVSKLLLFSIGHVQIAQAPTRGPPNSPGEINYQYILSIFEKLDYTGFIGLEFKCSGI